jgi:adenylate cyclase
VLVSFNAVNMILTGQFLTPAPPLVRWSLALVCPLLLGLAFWGRTPLLSSVAAVAVVGLLIGSSQYLFFQHDYVLPMAAPLFAVVLAMILVVGISHLREYSRASHVAAVLARFVSPALLRELDRTGTSRALPPVARKELTIMFVDMAGFTRLSDRHEPVEVAAFLVQFYELAIDVIYRNRGTLDKVLGDGILAYWGAPLDVPDKENWAARAALELQERFAVLARQQATRGWGDLKLRCGITTGYVSTGYLGGAKHAAYTIVGRAVNLASRIQSAAENGTCVLDRMTALRVEDRFELDERPPVKAKGLDEPVEIWRLMAEKTV